MTFADSLQAALNYIEANLSEKLDYADIAKAAACSQYHFQRVFGILCGFTLGEYIRNRRLTAAGAELALGGQKVADVAIKYCYESPDSFTKAFTRFHGITPSEAKKAGATLKSIAPLSVKISLEGASMMDYKIEEKPEMILTGYKRRFTGAPYGREREKQEEELFLTTRAGQWLLRGARGSRSDWNTDMCVIANVDDKGYDFYYAARLDEPVRKGLYHAAVSGIKHMEDFGFEDIVIPKATYAIFQTAHGKSPIPEYFEIRQKIASEWKLLSEWQFDNAPEISIYHWFTGELRDSRYAEIWMPICKKH